MKMQKQTARTMESLIPAYIKMMQLAPPLNRRRIYSAWDEVTGAGPQTLRRSLRDGKLYVTLNSSVLRSVLYMQRDIYIKRINELLAQDPLFTPTDSKVGYIKEIILK